MTDLRHISPLAGALAGCALLAACASEPLEPGQGLAPGPGQAYLSFALHGGGAEASRSGDFTAGDAREMKVTTLSFYFFKGSSRWNISTMLATTADISAQDPAGCNRVTIANPGLTLAPDDDAATVEQRTAITTLTFDHVPAPENIPLRVMVVANAPRQLLEQLDTLRQDGYVGEVIYSGPLHTPELGYVMANTRYINQARTGVGLLNGMTQANFRPTVNESQSPEYLVDVYLERNLGKVTTTIDVRAERTITQGGQRYYWVNYRRDGQQDDWVASIDDAGAVFAQIEGYHVAPEAQNPYLFKKINTQQWVPARAGYVEPFDGWFPDDYRRRRCYWAMNPHTSRGFEVRGTRSWADISASALDGAVYARENAAPAGNVGSSIPMDRQTPTSVVYAARLYKRDAAGAMQPWGHARYLDRDYGYATAPGQPWGDAGSDLHKLFIGFVQSRFGTLAWSDDGAAFHAMAPEHVQFVAEADAAGVCHYRATARLSDGNGRAKEWYAQQPDGTWQKIGANAKQCRVVLEAALADLGTAQIWADGRCYYYTPVKHLKFEQYNAQHSATGYDGVGLVRNHWYGVTVTDIHGYGTPVPDPENPITPERPRLDETFITTTVRVMDWRVVNYQHDFPW